MGYPKYSIRTPTREQPTQHLQDALLSALPGSARCWHKATSPCVFAFPRLSESMLESDHCAPFFQQCSKTHRSLLLVARPVGIELICSHIPELDFDNISSTYLGLLGSFEYHYAGSVVALPPMLALCRPRHPSCIPRPPHGSINHICVLPDRERGSGT
jgi:hypothetical protein